MLSFIHTANLFVTEFRDACPELVSLFFSLYSSLLIPYVSEIRVRLGSHPLLAELPLLICGRSSQLLPYIFCISPAWIYVSLYAKVIYDLLPGIF